MGQIATKHGIGSTRKDRVDAGLLAFLEESS